MILMLMTLITGVSLFSRLGLEQWLVRDVARLPDDNLHTAQGHYLHSAYRLLLISTVVFMLIWLLTGPLMKRWLFDSRFISCLC
ncbi:MAG: hypothetical protein R3E89_02835 [Thiolinea sp.]